MFSNRLGASCLFCLLASGTSVAQAPSAEAGALTAPPAPLAEAGTEEAAAKTDDATTASPSEDARASAPGADAETNAAETDGTETEAAEPATDGAETGAADPATDAAETERGVDVRLPALLDVDERDLLWVAPAAGAAIVLVASASSLLIGSVTFLRYDGSRNELLNLEDNYTGTREQDLALSIVRSEFDRRQRAYDDVGRGLLGIGIAKLVVGVALGALAGGAFAWRALDEDGEVDLDSSAPPAALIGAAGESTGDATEGDATEGDATEGNATEATASEGNASEGDASEGDATEGDATEGTATEGNASEGDATEGNATEATATEATASEGDATEGTATEGNASEGDATEGNATEATATEATATEGAATEGNATEGNATEGDATDRGLVTGSTAKKDGQ